MNDTGSVAPRGLGLVTPAWRDVLGRNALECDQPFDEAGGDSLKFMQFMLLLERASGRKFSAGAFHSGLRPHEMAALVEQALYGGNTRTTEQPVLFLCPGMGGYDPQLARLIAAFAPGCADPVRVEHIAYPSWKELLAAPDFNFAALIKTVVKQITSHNPKPPLLLAGYSFGGIVAWAAAFALNQAGYRVVFLGLLDSDASIGSADPAACFHPARHWAIVLREELRDLAKETRHGKGAEVLARIIVRRLKGPRWKPILRLTARIPQNWLPKNFSIYLYRDLLLWHLLPLLRQWKDFAALLPPLDAASFLFRTSDHEVDAPLDLGWSKRCRNLTVMAVPGTHSGMFQAEHLPDLSARFREAVAHVLTAAQIR